MFPTQNGSVEDRSMFPTYNGSVEDRAMFPTYNDPLLPRAMLIRMKRKMKKRNQYQRGLYRDQLLMLPKVTSPSPPHFQAPNQLPNHPLLRLRVRPYTVHPLRAFSTHYLYLKFRPFPQNMRHLLRKFMALGPMIINLIKIIRLCSPTNRRIEMSNYENHIIYSQ